MIYAIVPILVLALCLYLGKRLATLVVIIAYLNVEGFLKLLSNYNRVVHVGMDIVVLSLAIAWSASAVAQRKASLPALPWVRLILLYAFWIVLQVASPMSPGIIPSVAAFKLYLTMIPLYFFAATIVRTREDVVRLLSALTAIALLPYGMALVQYALGPASVVDLSPRFAQNLRGFHEWRPFGTSAVPGGTSVLAFLVTPLAVALFVASERGARRRLVASVAIGLAAAVFFVSGVRQIFLGCVLALLTMVAVIGAAQRRRGVVALALVLVLGGGAWVLVQDVLRPMATQALLSDPNAPDIWRETSVTERLGTLTRTNVLLTARAGGLKAIYTRIVHYPLGAGLGRIGPGAAALEVALGRDPETANIARELGFTESFFAVVLQELGIPGALMVTILLFGLPVTAVRLARSAHDPVVAAGAAAIAGIFVGVLVMSWGSQPLTSNPITAYYWLLAGVLAAMGRIERETEGTAEARAGHPSGDAARPLLA